MKFTRLNNRKCCKGCNNQNFNLQVAGVVTRSLVGGLELSLISIIIILGKIPGAYYQIKAKGGSLWPKFVNDSF